MDEDIVIYATGPVYCSVCVPLNFSTEEVEQAVNHKDPTGIPSLWKVANETFKNHSRNPHTCEDNPNRQHFLLNC